GLVVEGAAEASAGLARFEHYLQEYGKTPPAVITDLHMPGLLGTELAKRIKKLVPETRVILISGYITAEATHVSNPYVDVIIRKPFRFPDLIRHLQVPGSVAEEPAGD
ncbi:MAG: response regulator, partial [Armatimonadota bacterium]